MEERERCEIDLPYLAEAERGGLPSRFEPSAKLREKIKKLAPLRIKLSAIEFSEDDREFHGGNATVSRALLVIASNTEESAGTGPSQSSDGIHQSTDHATEHQKTGGEISEEKPGDRSRSGKQAQESDGQGARRKAVAVKKLRIADDTDLERTLGLALREAELLVGLSHSNVVRIEGFVEDVSNDIIWLVFPWESRGNLRDFLASQEWEIPERISLIYDVAEGLEYLHSQEPPICHGDLKSVNVLVNSRYCAVITDFGSAHRLGNKAPDGQAEHDEAKPLTALPLQATFCALTGTITLTGNNYTLRWAAPELLMDDRASLWSDIWALGWICYEAMTNSIPFQDVSTDVVVVERVIQGDLPSITDDTRMSLIRELCSLMITCWKHNPRERPTAIHCRKSISWMPMTFPKPTRATELPLPGTRSPELLIKLGYMYQWEDGYQNGSNFFAEALRVSTETGDHQHRVYAMCGLAQGRVHRNDYREAITLYSEALKISINIGSIEGKVKALCGIAEAHRVQRNYDEAIARYSEVLPLCTGPENGSGRASALWGLANVHRLRGEYNEAAKLYSDVLQIWDNIGNTKGKANALWGLAQVHFHQNQYEDAFGLYSQALQAFSDIGEKHGRAVSLFGLAEVHQRREEYSDAITLYSEVLKIHTEIGNGQWRAATLWSLAKVHRSQGHHSDAVYYYGQAADIFDQIGDTEAKKVALSYVDDIEFDGARS